MAQVAKRMNETGTPWWVLLITGISAFLLGMLSLFVPARTLLVITQLLGLYWLITGILDIVRIFTEQTGGWGWKLFSGILGILLGIVVLQHPIWSAVLIPTTLIYMLGFGGLVLGAIGIIQAFRGSGWGAVLLGAVSIIFGLLLLANPLLTGVVGLPIVLGFFGLFAGVVSVWYALRVRVIAKQMATEAAARTARGGNAKKSGRR
jgi:uncharacterized membrane protein HdeD (DUF308 family)